MRSIYCAIVTFRHRYRRHGNTFTNTKNEKIQWGKKAKKSQNVYWSFSFVVINRSNLFFSLLLFKHPSSTSTWISASAKGKLEPNSFYSIDTDGSLAMGVSMKFELRLDPFLIETGRVENIALFFFSRKKAKTEMKINFRP